MDMFYDDLHEYMNLANPNINLEPIIGNKQLDLWQLAEAVGSQNVDIDNVDWEQVANHLGYDDSNQSLLDQLLECWEANLRDFLDFMEEFDKAQQDAAPSADSDHEALVNIVGEEEDEQTIIPSTVEEDNDAEPRLPSLALPSWATKKRPFEASPLAAANTFVKRRRLAPDAVVPSTPEELIGIPASVSGKPQQSPSLIRSQRMLRQRHLNLDDTIKDSQDDTQDRLQSPPRATGARSPELGSFEVSTPVLQRIESAYDITPSQQLESEAESPLARAGKRVTITVPHDEPEDEVQSSHQHSPSPQPAASSLHVAKRRALPSSFRNSSAPSASQASAQTESVRRHSTALKTTQRQDQGRRALSRGNPPSMARKPSSIPEWAEHYESLGYPRATVNKAMLATTMNPGTLVVTVLESLTQGGGIPPNHAGIWTDRDDGGIHLLLHAGDDLGRAPLDIEEELMLKRARKEEGRLLRKHGELWTATRKQYWVEKNAFEAKKRKKKELKMLMEQTENRSDTSM